MELSCPHCAAPIPLSSVDNVRQIATCGACRHLVDLAPQLNAPQPQTQQATPPQLQPRLRPPVKLPAGLAIRHEDSVFRAHVPSSVHITRRWLRGKHYVLLLVFLGLSAALGWSIHRDGLGFWTGLGALVLLNFDYLLLAMFLNRTQVFAGQGEVRVSHGPVPTLGAKGVRFQASELKQLYAVQQSGRYAVKADLANGQSVVLVAPLVSAEQALFIEQQLEQALGIVDFEVPAELSSSLPARVAQASGSQPSKATAGLAALLPLGLTGGIAALIFYSLGTEVTGSLELEGQRPLAFVPSDCRSGQAYGFFGVDVVDESGQAVRVISDPVHGPIVMVQRQAGQSERLALTGCRTLDVKIQRTNTTVNDIRVLDGSAHLDCPNVKANLTFTGCH